MNSTTQNLIRSALGLLAGALVMANLLLWLNNRQPVPPQQGKPVWCQHECRFR